MNKSITEQNHLRFKSLCLLVVAVVCLAACSSIVRDGREEHLRIELLKNGSKQFYYWVGTGYVDPRNEAKVLSVRQTRKRQMRSPPGEKEYRQLQKRAAEIVLREQYCREGFLQLDYRLASSQYWLRGECRESATKLDRQRFGEMTEIPLH